MHGRVVPCAMRMYGMYRPFQSCLAQRRHTRFVFFSDIWCIRHSGRGTLSASRTQAVHVALPFLLCVQDSSCSRGTTIKKQTNDAIPISLVSRACRRRCAATMWTLKALERHTSSRGDQRGLPRGRCALLYNAFFFTNFKAKGDKTASTLTDLA